MRTNTSIAILASSVAAMAAEPEVSLVQYRVSASLSDAIPFEVKPMGHDYGAELAFLIEGEQLVAVKKGSVEITGFVGRDGESMAKARSGKPLWEFGPFPKVSNDGKHGSFTLKARGDFIGKLEGSEIEGTLVVSTGGDTDKGKATIAKEAKPIEIGPFKVSWSKASGGFFGGGGIGIKVVGDHGAITEITAKADGKELDSSGSSWSGDTRTYSFSDTDTDEIEVAISFWKDLKELTVPFKVTLGAK